MKNKRLWTSLIFSFLSSLYGVQAIASKELCVVALRGPHASSMKHQPSNLENRTARESIAWRLQQGDIDKVAAQEALTELSHLPKGSPSLLGANFNQCYLKFGSRAVDSLHRLIGSLKGVKDPSQMMPHLQQKYAQIFKVSEDEAKKRLCILAGAGPIGTSSCQIFGELVTKSCPL